MPPKVERDELLADFRRVASEMGERPTMDEYCERGEYSRTVIYGRFDSFEDLKEAAGFERGEHRIPAGDLLDDLRRVADEIDRTPPVEVYRDRGEYNWKTLERRFGNWKDVLKKADLEPTDHSRHFNSVEYLHQDYRENSYTGAECSNCGDEIAVRKHRIDDYENVFCGHECRAEYLSGLTGEDAHSWEGGEETADCEECGDSYSDTPAAMDRRRFCSQECMLKWHKREFSGEGHHRWRGGYEPYYGPNWKDQRRKARERDGYKCQICGIGREEHREKYGEEPHVHHIKRLNDFDEPLEANQLPNLVTLCKRHHNMVDAGNAELPDAYKEKFEDWATS